MNVTVRLYGILRRFEPGHDPKEPLRLEIQEGGSVADLAGPLGIPRDWAVTAVVNREVSRPNRVLVDGDQVQLFPPVAGGQVGPL